MYQKSEQDNCSANCITIYDLDGFKKLNDTWVMDIGDKVLTQDSGLRLKKICALKPHLLCPLGWGRFLGV